MSFNLVELTTKNEIAGTYDIYKHCMFMPSKEKFNKKIAYFLNDDTIKIFACVHHDEINGVIVISFVEPRKVEIIGIAVDMSARNLGIGSFMINKLAADYDLLAISAETDDDAVNFYRKNGFSITEFSKTYGENTVTRYRCELEVKHE